MFLYKYRKITLLELNPILKDSLNECKNNKATLLIFCIEDFDNYIILIKI
jgi:hypothetical protein